MRYSIKGQEQIEYDYESLQDVISRAAYWKNYVANCEDSIIASEALADHFLGRALIGIVDTVAGLANTFKTNVFKFTKTLKRSEMKEYYESHLLRVSQVEGMSYDKIYKLDIVFPDGMKVSYMEAIQNIKKLMQLMTAPVLFDKMDHLFTDVYRYTSRNEIDRALRTVEDVVELVKSKTKQCESNIKACNSDFGGGITQTKPFGKCYASMEEFRNVRKELLGMEGYLQDANNIQTRMDSIVSSLNGVLDLISKNETKLPKELVEKLADVVTNSAKLMDAYGTNAIRQAAIEHNHILVVNALYNQ